MMSSRGNRSVVINVISWFIFALIFTGCKNMDTPSTSPTSTGEPTATATSTSTPQPTQTISVFPTTDSFGDPDGDGYITENEQIWGTDPFVNTSFEELSSLPGTIYTKMRVSQPFEIADMNNTIYQVIRLIEMEDNNTPENISDDHLVFEAVIFPYAHYSEADITTPIESFPIDPSIYPKDIQEYLSSYENDISNITDELRKTMLIIVNGSGEGYTTPAKTVVEAIERIIKWNQDYFSVDPIYETYYPKYQEINTFRSGDMFESQKTRYCITRATILNAELKAIGIPSAIFFNVSCACNPNDDIECDQRGKHFHNHIQNGVYLEGKWVLFDYNEVDPRSEPYHNNLIILDKYRDNSEVDFNFWYYILDTPRIYYPFEELYYIYVRN